MSQMNNTEKNQNDLVKIWNGNVMLTYSKDFNGFFIDWMLNDRKVFDTNHKAAYTKAYKSSKKWANTMEKIIMSFNDETTYNDICKIVGISNYTEYYTDN
jgi:hypothetical protein